MKWLRGRYVSMKPNMPLVAAIILVSCTFSAFDHAKGSGWLWILDFSKPFTFLTAFSVLFCAGLFLVLPFLRSPDQFIVKLVRRIYHFIVTPAWTERY